MAVLVDTSVWVEYFRSGNSFEQLDFLIDENLVVTNDLILSELIPFLKIRNQRKLISLLSKIYKFEIVVNWGQLVELQYKCLTQVNGETSQDKCLEGCFNLTILKVLIKFLVFYDRLSAVRH